MNKLVLAGACAGLCFSSAASFAHDGQNHGSSLHISGDGASITADEHGPIGVMGNHMHDAGEWMVSYKFKRMNMEGNRDGTDDLSPEEIVTTVPNRFANPPMQPPTLRVVPTEMDMDMHMFGGMFAPTDWLTLMAMGHYMTKDMSHITFMGPAGTTRLGTFETETSGWGDTKLSGLFRVYEDDTHHIHLTGGVSLPTGSIDEEDTILTPMNMTPRVRLPYAMQLGTGTYDLLPGITYSGKDGRFGWGAQYSSEIRLGDNDEDYTFGDKHALTGWVSYLWAPEVSTSLRVTGETEQDIDGIDSNIVLPVQTADPDNYGGERVEIGLGANFVATSGFLKGHRFEAEVVLPVHQDLNGPQMERDYAFTIGWSKSF